MPKVSLGEIITRENAYLTAVVNSHLATEAILDQMIESWIAELSIKPGIPKYYKPKLDFLYFAGLLNSASYTKLCSLNSLRSKFAHKLDYRITENDVIKLGQEINSKETLYSNLIMALGAILGFLVSNAESSINQPFMTLLINREKIIKSDESFKTISTIEISKAYQVAIEELAKRNDETTDKTEYFIEEILNIYKKV